MKQIAGILAVLGLTVSAVVSSGTSVVAAEDTTCSRALPKLQKMVQVADRLAEGDPFLTGLERVENVRKLRRLMPEIDYQLSNAAAARWLDDARHIIFFELRPGSPDFLRNITLTRQDVAMARDIVETSCA